MRPQTVDRGGPRADAQQRADPQPTVDSLRSIERPSLEYQHAFDLCAVEAHRVAGPVAVLAGSPFYARELLKRLGGSPVVFCPVGGWGDGFEDGWGALSPEVTWDRVVVMKPGGEETPLPVAAAIWAEPEKGDGEAALGHIRPTLQPGGRLWVVTSGQLCRFLPEWQRAKDRPARDPARLRQVIRWLRGGGFTVEALYGFHGPASILWGYVFRLMERLGRGDLADRCHFAMRARYVVSGWQAFWCPVGVAVAARKE